MKLCADILYWRLKEKLTMVTQRGKGGSALTLNLPIICPKVRSWGKMCA